VGVVLCRLRVSCWPQQLLEEAEAEVAEEAAAVELAVCRVLEQVVRSGGQAVAGGVPSAAFSNAAALLENLV
jgi:hypothetical protein